MPPVEQREIETDHFFLSAGRAQNTQLAGTKTALRFSSLYVHPHVHVLHVQ